MGWQIEDVLVLILLVALAVGELVSATADQPTPLICRCPAQPGNGGE